MARIDIKSAGATLNDGVLQLENGVAMDTTLRNVSDQNNTTSPLKLSTTAVQVVSPLRITTDDPSDMYLDCEDGATNNRFNITRNTASQQVNLNFASNPGGSTTVVGGIRTFVDGVNLTEVMKFREDGQLQIGSTAASAMYWDNTNNRLGIGTSSPTESLDINGSFRISQPSTVNAFTFAVSGTSVAMSNGGQGTLSVSGINSMINAGTGQYPEYRLNNKTTLKEQDTTTMSIANGYSALQFSVGNTERARLFSTGNFIINSTTDLGARLGIKGSGSTSATTSLLVQNSAGTELLKVTDDGNVFLGSQKNLTWNTGNFIVGDTTANTMTFYVASSIALQLGASTNSIQRATSTRDLFASSDNSFDFGQQFLRYRNGWFGGQLKIGDATAVNASAKVQIDSTTQGFLPPRMTNAQRLAIATPAVGLMVYCTDAVEGLYIYKSTGWTFVI